MLVSSVGLDGRPRSFVTTSLSLLPSLRPALRCGHIHDPNEWRSPNSGQFSTFNEAEYTPSLVFTLAVCCAAWAARQGYGILAIPRLPPIATSGDVRPLLPFEPSELRGDLMTVMGFHLGLSPPLEDSSHVPTRQVAVDVLRMRTRLTDGDVYIGPGHFSHRWPLTQWQNPFKAGEGRTALESVLHYARWIADQDHLLADLSSLHFKNLVCDCPHNVLCHGDIIRALVWATSRTTSSPGHRQHRSRAQLRRVSLVAAGIRPARAAPLRFSQEIIVASFMALCPEINWDGFKWPMIEDLLVDDGHYQWLNYMQNRPARDGQSFGPRLVGPLKRTAIAMSGLQQSSAAAAAKALPPVIPFGVGEDRHFELALELQQRPTPFESMGVVDDDLIFAAAGRSSSWLF